MYDWKPEACSHCNVFGHSYEKCRNRPRSEDEKKAQINVEEKEKRDQEAKAKKDFEERQNKSINWQQQRRNAPAQGNDNRQVYKAKMNNDTEKNKEKEFEEEFPALQQNKNPIGKTKHKDLNRFAPLETLDYNEIQEMDVMKDKIIEDKMVKMNSKPTSEEVDILTLWQKQEEMVDMFLNSKRIPTDDELKTWARYMCEWYKGKWEAKWKSKCPIAGRYIWIKD